MWSGASARTSSSSAFGSSTAWTSSVRTTIRWLATPSRTLLRQIVVGEQLAQLLGERDGVGDLAVAHDAGTQVGDAPFGDRELPVDLDLGGGEMARIHLEPDDGLLLAAA